jgi:hypothetical protein
VRVRGRVRVRVRVRMRVRRCRLTLGSEVAGSSWWGAVLVMTGWELEVALCARPPLALQPPSVHTRSKCSPSALACSSSAEAPEPPAFVREGATCARGGAR